MTHTQMRLEKFSPVHPVLVLLGGLTPIKRSRTRVTQHLALQHCATFHRNPTTPSLPNPLHFYDSKKISIKEMNDTQGIN